MEVATGRCAQSRDIAGIAGDFRFDQYDMKRFCICHDQLRLLSLYKSVIIIILLKITFCRETANGAVGIIRWLSNTII